MSAWSHAWKRAVLAIAVNAIATAGAIAQSSQPVPNALQGFSQNSDKPVQIKAQTFEVRDKENVAVFTGNVHVVQGDTTIRCKTLIVSYLSGSSPPGAARAAQPGPGPNSQAIKSQARGSDVFIPADSTASGESVD